MALRVPSRCLGAGAPSVLVVPLVALVFAGALGAAVRATLAGLAGQDAIKPCVTPKPQKSAGLPTQLIPPP